LFFNYFHTIRHLKLSQIYYRVKLILVKPSINKNIDFQIRISKNKFCQPILKKKSLLSKNKFYFLNKIKSILKIGWNGNNNLVSKLWRYNQHYFDDLNAIGSLKRKKWHRKLMADWVNNNQIGIGIGWESYPISIRAVNWIKWYISGNSFSDFFKHSLVLQVRWLFRRLEWHLLGNHLFSNAKALIFAGLFFSTKESKTWLQKGLKIIDNELNEQVLADGGHFELSPMYHSIFLEDLLDLINIAKTYPKIIKISQIKKWKKIAIKMLKWLDAMNHPNGDISLFNDSANGIAPTLNQLENYAKRLGVNYSKNKFKKVTKLINSGYIRIDSKDYTALLDVAKIGPDYLPGHAHADTLSFEISLFRQLLLVNGGTSEYEIGSIRKFERSSRAHNTVTINNKDSSEVWSSFRVARRAYPFELKIKELKNLISINCSHDGYKRLRGKPIHERNWQFFQSSVVIEDQIKGSFDNAFAYFHFHPSIKILKKNDTILKLIMLNKKKVVLNIKKGKPFLEKSYYSPEFGKRIITKCLKVSLDKVNGSSIQISW